MGRGSQKEASRQDMLDVSNKDHAGVTDANVVSVSLTFDPEHGGWFVGLQGVLEPLADLSVPELTAATLRARARAVELWKATEVVEKLEERVGVLYGPTGHSWGQTGSTG